MFLFFMHLRILNMRQRYQIKFKQNMVCLILFEVNNFSRLHIIKLMIKLHGTTEQYNTNSNKIKSPQIPKSNQIYENKNKIKSNEQQIDNYKSQNGRLQKITKTKPNENNDDGDYYDDDFEEPTYQQKRKNTQNLQNSRKRQQKLSNKHSSKQKKQDNLKLKRQVKSVMDIKKQLIITSEAPEFGKYQAEVDRKFNSISQQALSNEAIIKSNDQIRECIKKYNDILSDIINKNLRDFNAKKVKTTTVQQTIKILNQQLKNNSKIQQLDLVQLKRLQAYKAKLDQDQFNNQKQNEHQQFTNLNSKIKQIQKQITNLKFNVKNESKKLSIAEPITKSQLPTEVTTLKQKIIKLKKDLQKNQQKLNKLGSQQTQLTSKVQSIAEKDKEATKVKVQSKNNEQKSKKYQQTRKKYDNLKAHITKTQQLWNAKCLVSAHQNQGLKQKVKNLQLQIKNMEDSVKQSYEKTTKMLSQTKYKNENQQKTMQKIFEGMKAYSTFDENMLDKQASLSNMKMIIGKKHSSHNMSTNALNAQHTQLNSDSKNETKQDKEKNQKNVASRQSERNRVWRQQHALGQADNQMQREVNDIRKSFNDKYTSQKKQQDQAEIKNDKPLRMNLNKKRVNSQLAKPNSHVEVPKSEQKLKIQNNIVLNSNIDEVNQKKEENNDKQPEDIAIKSRRFNLNIKNRKKQESPQVLNENAEKQKPQVLEQKQKQPERLSNQNIQKSKPVFNLKKKRESENKKQNVQNQFILPQ